jgi:hypothetical protein
MGSKTSDQMRTPTVPATCDLMSDSPVMASTAGSTVPGAAPEVIAGERCCPAGGPERDPPGPPGLTTWCAITIAALS